MKRFITILILLITFCDLRAQEFDVDTLLFNGPGEQRINYVVLGDGYRQSELPVFIKDAEKIIEDLFEAPPFTQYEPYFNVFAISVPSNVSGAALNPDQLIDNYYGSTFNFAGIERLLVPTRNDRINQVLANNFPAYDQVLMVVNSSKYGGSGGSIATSSTNAAASEISIHEVGHSFGNLSDEYWAGAQYAFESPNMTQIASVTLVKWKNWINDLGIGIIPHSDDPSWYKPHDNCKMQFLGVPFCAVCKEQLIKNIQSLTSPIDSYSPVAASEIGDVIAFDLTIVAPDPNTLEAIWWLDGTRLAVDVASLDIDVSDLTAGSHVVEAQILDATTFDRRDRVEVTTVKWNISNGITSDVDQKFSDREDLNEVVSVTSEVSSFSLQTYPNPTDANWSIEYDLTEFSRIEMSITNLNGRHVQSLLNEDQAPGNYHQEIDVSSHPNGIYILTFKSGNFVKTKRLIKSD